MKSLMIIYSSTSTHTHIVDTFTNSCLHTQTQTYWASVYLVTNLNWSCYSSPMGPPLVSSLPSSLLLLPPQSSKYFSLIFCPLPTSSVLLFWPTFSLCLSVGDPEFSSNMTPQHGLSLSSLAFFSLLFSSVCPSLACLCSPLHRVSRTEGWDLQQQVLLSRGFDQTESQERSLTDC